MDEKLLPPLPAALVRARRSPTAQTSQRPPVHSSQRPPFHSSQQLSPVSEIPHPSEIQMMQLEVDVLKQELATAQRQAGEMELQVASMNKEIQRYQLHISRQNRFVAQIFNTIKLVYSNYHVAAERFQFIETALPGMEKVATQEDGGWI
ncbi:hypothetical protein V8F33_010329 [Rhypophila sp. PSN 637]